MHGLMGTAQTPRSRSGACANESQTARINIAVNQLPNPGTIGVAAIAIMFGAFR
jgi:hypothetical protein